MPSKQEERPIPKLADFLDDDVDEKYYIPDERAQGIIEKALDKLIREGKLHLAPTEPAVLRSSRNEYGREIRKQYEAGEITAKRSEMKTPEPRPDGISNTLTTVLKDNLLIEPTEEIEKAICNETGLLNPNEIGRTLRVAGGVTVKETQLSTHPRPPRQRSRSTFWRECQRRHSRRTKKRKRRISRTKPDAPIVGSQGTAPRNRRIERRRGR